MVACGAASVISKPESHFMKPSKKWRWRQPSMIRDFLLCDKMNGRIPLLRYPFFHLCRKFMILRTLKWGGMAFISHEVDAVVCCCPRLPWNMAGIVSLFFN